MQYRKFGSTGREHSPLGFGMMRLQRTADGKIDQEWVTKMLRYAIDRGMNYVDTAYAYQGSEAATGIALQDGYRDRVTLASKLPVGAMTCEEDFDRMLGETLERLQTDHVDCYMLHAMGWEKFKKSQEQFHLLEHMEKAKAEGKIKHIGFSFHDSLDAFKKILDAYDGWEFCQIQLNYLDVNYQAGLEGLKLAASRGIAVIIMEPLRGGRLANVPEDVAAMLPKSPVESALDFLWDMPEVSVVLSGMSDTEQVMQNVEYAQRASVGMLTEEERKAMIAAGDKMRGYMSIPCTGCDYCHVCPNEIAIPTIFAIHNQKQLDGDDAGAKARYRALGEKNAESCVKCGICVEQCPQHIQIFEELAKIHENLG